MIVGVFDELGRPYVEGIVYIPRLAVGGRVRFRLDTGADVTHLHSREDDELRIPFGRLGNPVVSRGVGGGSLYYVEQALISFDNDGEREICSIDLLIDAPGGSNEGLPSLLGLDVVNRWYMEYDPVGGRLEFMVG